MTAAAGGGRVADGRRESPAVRAAYSLCRQLEFHRIAADVHEGDGVALVSIWVTLVVWCEDGPDGTTRFRWWSGRTSARTGRWVYTYCPAGAAATAARRIADRYAELRATHPLSPMIAERLVAAYGGRA